MCLNYAVIPHNSIQVKFTIVQSEDLVEVNINRGFQSFLSISGGLA